MTIQEILDVLNFDRSSEIFSFCYKLDELIDSNNNDEVISCIQVRFNCDRETANGVFIEYKKQIYDTIKNYRNENPLSPEQIAYNNMIAKELLNKPKCPICGSKNLSKIKTIEKVMKIAAFGIYGMGDNGKTYKCNNCGSKF